MKLLETKVEELDIIFILVIIISMIYSSLYATLMIFNIEESLDVEYFPTIQDRLYCFFQIFFWIVGIWVLQPKLNEFEERINKTSL